MNTRQNAEPRIAEREFALQQPRPEIKRLLNVGQIVRRCDHRTVRLEQLEPDSPQMQSMRVLPHPVEECFLAARAGRIADFAPVGVVNLIPEIHWIDAWRRGGCMPAPMRGRAKWEIRVIFVWKGLQPGDVRCKCEFAVPDGERRKGIGSMNDGVEPLNECLSIDRGYGAHLKMNIKPVSVRVF